MRKFYLGEVFCSDIFGQFSRDLYNVSLGAAAFYDRFLSSLEFEALQFAISLLFRPTMSVAYHRDLLNFSDVFEEIPQGVQLLRHIKNAGHRVF